MWVNPPIFPEIDYMRVPIILEEMCMHAYETDGWGPNERVCEENSVLYLHRLHIQREQNKRHNSGPKIAGEIFLVYTKGREGDLYKE